MDVSQERLTLEKQQEGGTPNMRTVLASICLLGLFAGFRTVQERGKPRSPLFDPPAIISTFEAIYPLQSVASGTVVLEVALDDIGKITDVRVVRGIPSLTESAERSVRQWKFRPAQLDGEPVHSKMAVAFSFVPPNGGPRI
jgi:TonB family protein